MRNIDNIDGDVKIERHVDVGGNVRVYHNVDVKHNVRIEGWLEAPNIKGINKGVFTTVEELRRVYPRPKAGWMALVGTSVPMDVWVVAQVNGQYQWVESGGTSGEIVMDYGELPDLISRLERLEEEMEGTSEDELYDIKRDLAQVLRYIYPDAYNEETHDPDWFETLTGEGEGYDSIKSIVETLRGLYEEVQILQQLPVITPQKTKQSLVVDHICAGEISTWSEVGNIYRANAVHGRPGWYWVKIGKLEEGDSMRLSPTYLQRICGDGYVFNAADIATNYVAGVSTGVLSFTSEDEERIITLDSITEKAHQCNVSKVKIYMAINLGDEGQYITSRLGGGFSIVSDVPSRIKPLGKRDVSLYDFDIIRRRPWGNRALTEKDQSKVEVVKSLSAIQRCIGKIQIQRLRWNNHRRDCSGRGERPSGYVKISNPYWSWTNSGRLRLHIDSGQRELVRMRLRSNSGNYGRWSYFMIATSKTENNTINIWQLSDEVTFNQTNLAHTMRMLERGMANLRNYRKVILG